MNTRTIARTFSFQFFYNQVFNNDISYENDNILKLKIQSFKETLNLPIEQEDFVFSLISSASKNYNDSISEIEEKLFNWKLNRVDLITKTILVLAITEMLFLSPPTPGKVVINEYLELAKKFGNKDAKSFINGILDKVHHGSK